MGLWKVGWKLIRDWVFFFKYVKCKYDGLIKFFNNWVLLKFLLSINRISWRRFWKLKKWKFFIHQKYCFSWESFKIPKKLIRPCLDGISDLVFDWTDSSFGFANLKRKFWLGQYLRNQLRENTWGQYLRNLVQQGILKYELSIYHNSKSPSRTRCTLPTFSK